MMLSDLRNDIVDMVERRDRFIASLNLDPAFCRPDGNWHCDSDNDYLDKYRQLRICPIENVPDEIFPLSINHRGPWRADTYKAYVKLLFSLGFERTGNLNILEIGAGNGALAIELLKTLGSEITNYNICDIPESLLFSGLYISLAGKQIKANATVNLVPNYFFEVLNWGKIDLVINTLSMSEMSEHQVRVYARGISKLIGTSGMFFEINHDNSQHEWGKNRGNDIGYGINAKDYLVEYFRGSVSIGEADIWSNDIWFLQKEMRKVQQSECRLLSP